MKKLSIKIITLFPNFIEDFVGNFGIIGKAVKNKLLEIEPIFLRDFGIDKRGTVDDRPYGGGAGMVLRADVLIKAIQAAQKSQNPKSKSQINSKSKIPNIKSKVILLTPQGKKFNQKMAQRLSRFNNLVLVCGRYEGFDERIRKFVDEEISIGDYILMGGELPALVLTEAVVRLRPGVLGKYESSVNESFSSSSSSVADLLGRASLQLLEYPQYTKPETLRIKDKRVRTKTLQVPKVLLTGHHRKIKEWREKQALKRTKKRRPDLLIKLKKLNIPLIDDRQ